MRIWVISFRMTMPRFLKFKKSFSCTVLYIKVNILNKFTRSSGLEVVDFCRDYSCRSWPCWRRWKGRARCRAAISVWKQWTRTTGCARPALGRGEWQRSGWRTTSKGPDELLPLLDPSEFSTWSQICKFSAVFVDFYSVQFVALKLDLVKLTNF